MSAHDDRAPRGTADAPTTPLRGDRPADAGHDGRDRPAVDQDRDRSDGYDEIEQRRTVKPAKTSVAAAFALALGVAALLLVLTIILSPIGLVLGIIGIILGILGIRAAKKAGTTGRGVAITGLILSVLAVLLAAAAAIGITTFLNNEGAVNSVEQQVQQLRDRLPA